MAKKNKANNCIKNGVYIYDRATYEKVGAPPKKDILPVIKWYQVDMSFEDKMRFNLLTYQDILQWQAEQAMAEQAAQSQPEADHSLDRTFWTADTEERVNLSSDEYSAFLSKNNIDVSNRTSLDFDSLYSEVTSVSEEQAVIQTTSEPETSADTPSYEPTEEEILANVNRDIHGGDAILSQEEIEALFAAAAAQGI